MAILFYSQVEPFKLILPPLLIQCPTTITQGQIFRVKISFTNILHHSLSRVLFLVQGQALCPQRELSHKSVKKKFFFFMIAIICRRLVFPGAIASVEFTLRAHPTGSFHLLVSMFCDQLTDVRGHTVITVQPPLLS